MSNITLSRKARSLKKGYYEHYKKLRYKVLGVVIHSETLEEMVLYKAMYGEKITWVRPLKMFFEKVEVDGKKVPRFRFIK
jgi:cyclomaltodextrinase / maltogenic alpha-amylase / neopullulanase